jgi:hypothetical protein
MNIMTSEVVTSLCILKSYITNTNITIMRTTEMGILGSHRGENKDDNLLDRAPCSLVEVDRRFRGAYYLHQGDE